MKLALLCLGLAAAATGAPLSPTRQEFLLLRGVASQIQILKLNIEAYPEATEKVIAKIYPDIVTIFDANKNGVLEPADLMALYPSIAAYHRQFIAGKFVRLPIAGSPQEFAAGHDKNGDGVISPEEINNLIVRMVGTPVWNTAMLHFVASFDSEAAQQGYLSPAETKAIAQKIMAELAGKEEPASLANPIGSGAPASPDKIKISVVNKMELLRKRFADAKNLPFAAQIIKANAKAIYDTADMDKDGKVTSGELEQVWQITKDYLEGKLLRQGRMVPESEWMAMLGVKPDGQVSLSDDELVSIMTTKLTAPMWESFMACLFNLAIDGNQDGQLSMGELASFKGSPFYQLFQLPLDLKFQN